MVAVVVVAIISRRLAIVVQRFLLLQTTSREGSNSGRSSRFCSLEETSRYTHFWPFWNQNGRFFLGRKEAFGRKQKVSREEIYKNTLTSPALGKFGREKNNWKKFGLSSFSLLKCFGKCGWLLCSESSRCGVFAVVPKEEISSKVIFRGETESLRGKFRTKAFSLLTGCFWKTAVRPLTPRICTRTFIRGKRRKGKITFWFLAAWRFFVLRLLQTSRVFTHLFLSALFSTTFFLSQGQKEVGFADYKCLVCGTIRCAYSHAFLFSIKFNTLVIVVVGDKKEGKTTNNNNSSLFSFFGAGWGVHGGTGEGGWQRKLSTIFMGGGSVFLGMSHRILSPSLS